MATVFGALIVLAIFVLAIRVEIHLLSKRVGKLESDNAAQMKGWNGKLDERPHQ